MPLLEADKLPAVSALYLVDKFTSLADNF